MSSQYVRDSIIAFIGTEIPGEKLVDFTAEFEELSDFLEYNNIGPGDNWIAVQFVGSEEIPVDVRGTNTKGTYREIGLVHIHVVSVARLGGHNDILTRAEAIRDKFRGQRIDTILIESVSPPNFGTGIALNFSGGYTAATFNIGFQRDLNL
jgi:hypothetical protein